MRPVKRRHLGAPCQPRGSDSRLCPWLGWLSPWVGELRSCKLCRVAKKKKKKKGRGKHLIRLLACGGKALTMLRSDGWPRRSQE